MSGQENKLDAAEYVIGTLSAAERTAFEASIELDSETRDDVLFWERAFGSLNASVAPEAPPEGLWGKIEKSISDEAQTTVSTSAARSASKPMAANDNVAEKLRRSVARWRMGAIAASVAAIGLGVFILNSPNNPFLPQEAPVVADLGSREYIAVVNANGDQPSLVVNIDGKTGEVIVRSIGVERPDGKSLEVWYVPDGELTKAVSVGLVGEGEIDLKDIQAKDGDLLAISVEPPGGSPIEKATGAIIYTGTLIENVNPD
ncbi:MAG: anti-sigma factor [Rhizobiaceae bacterium]